MATLIWGERSEVHVSSIEELNQLLNELTREAEQGQPTIVELVGDDGATVSIGLGRPRSVANYVPASLDPPYLQSLGDEGGEDELVFYYRGEFSEFPPQCGIPADAARACLLRFYETGALPTNITWQET